MFGVYTRRSEEQQFLHPGFVRAVNDVGFDHQIVVEEVRRFVVIRLDAADTRGGTPEDYTEFFVSDIKQYMQLTQATGIQQNP